jgi:hypothetical protein
MFRVDRKGVDMERKVSGSTTVTAKEIKVALEKARTLAPEEEKVLRMRHGAGAASKSAPLPRAAGQNEELGDELLLIEMQLMKAMRERTGQVKTASNKPQTAASAKATKEKIVRALKKK